MRRVVLAMLLLTGSIGVLVLWSDQRPPSLAQCGELGERAARSECVGRVLAEVAGASGPAAAAEVLAAGLAADPGLWDVCHDAAHAAVRVATGRELAEMLARPDVVGVCDWGLFHGALEASLSGGLTAEGFEQLTRDGCVGPDRGFVLGCADSFGHALFAADGDFVSAALRCDAALSGEASSYCVGGVFMQLYEPVGGTGEELLSWDAVPSLCSGLPDEALVGACAQAAHYAAGRPLRLLVRSAPSGVSADVLASRLVEAAPAALAEGLSLCGELTDPGGLCERSLLVYAVQSLRGLPLELVDELVCRRASSAESMSYCRDALQAV